MIQSGDDNGRMILGSFPARTSDLTNRSDNGRETGWEYIRPQLASLGSPTQRILHPLAVVPGSNPPRPQANDEFLLCTRKQKASEGGIRGNSIPFEETLEQRTGAL